MPSCTSSAIFAFGNFSLTKTAFGASRLVRSTDVACNLVTSGSTSQCLLLPGLVQYWIKRS